MSAIMLTLHADRPPVVQLPRRGPPPRGVVSLPAVRRERAYRADQRQHLQQLRAEVHGYLAGIAEQRARNVKCLTLTTEAMAGEYREAARSALVQCDREERDMFARLAEIDRKLRLLGSD